MPKRPAHTDPTRISSSAGLRSFFGEGGSVALKRVGLQAERVQASADSDSQRERSMSRYIYIYRCIGFCFNFCFMTISQCMACGRIACCLGLRFEFVDFCCGVLGTSGLGGCLELIKEYSLNHITDPTIVFNYGIFLKTC